MGVTEEPDMTERLDNKEQQCPIMKRQWRVWGVAFQTIDHNLFVSHEINLGVLLPAF